MRVLESNITSARNIIEHLNGDDSLPFRDSIAYLNEYILVTRDEESQLLDVFLRIIDQRVCDSVAETA